MVAVRSIGVAGFKAALDKAAAVRYRAGLDLNGPICVFDLCLDMGFTVRGLDVNLDGAYHPGKPPIILVGSKRPLTRRVFTCGHELGHDQFGHGVALEEVMDHDRSASKDPNEQLANAFAGYLLMPKIGISGAFRVREWDPTNPTEAQVYVVACEFGVGYETLINHMAWSLKLLSVPRANSLLKMRQDKIRESILGRPSTCTLVVAGHKSTRPTYDVEVGMEVLVPRGVVAAEGLQVIDEVRHGRVLLAVKPGVYQVSDPARDWAIFIRVARFEYVGLYEYRHFPDEEEDEEGASS